MVAQRSAAKVAEHVARDSYGRLISLLSSRSRDIEASEDALSEAFLSALRTWPETGIPDNPHAWLITAARNRLINQNRHRGVIDASLEDLARAFPEFTESENEIPDERLQLLFVCAHPAIDESIRAPLMMQTVLGLDAVQIGAAFLVAPTTMGQRLVRAKAKIKEAGLRFAVPEPEEMPERLQDLLNGIYAAYGTSWAAIPGQEAGCGDLAEEAIFLTRLLVKLLPKEPEARGLLALMLYCEARRAARRDKEGKFVPLKDQDAGLWNRDHIIEAEAQLTRASQAGRFGRFQCEAAIQSVHIQRPITGRTNHQALLTLYPLLVTHFPSVGAMVAYAAALLDAGEVLQALDVLLKLAQEDVRQYQPFWVTLAAVHSALGQTQEAHESLANAISLTEDPAIRVFLANQQGSV